MGGTAGIIGLGIMGGAMARHMVQGGFSMAVKIFGARSLL